MAESSAVDYPDLGGPSVVAERWSRTSQSSRELSTAAPVEHSSGPILLEVGPSYKSTNSTISATSLVSTPIPLLEVHPSLKQTRGTRRSRKGKRKRAEATYYRPSDELGGKSQMTLWGHGVGMPVRVKSRR